MTRTTRRNRALVAGGLAALVLLAGSCTTPPAPTTTDPGTSTELLPLTATRGTDAALYDSAGRQVTLRGANFNQLGDYFVTDPRLPAVATLDEADWDDAQAYGFNVVRLVTTWSAWEPERDQIDEAYAQRVVDAVEQARILDDIRARARQEQQRQLRASTQTGRGGR